MKPPQNHGELVTSVLKEMQRWGQGFAPIADKSISIVAEEMDKNCSPYDTMMFLSKFIEYTADIYKEKHKHDEVLRRDS